MIRDPETRTLEEMVAERIAAEAPEPVRNSGKPGFTLVRHHESDEDACFKALQALLGKGLTPR